MTSLKHLIENKNNIIIALDMDGVLCNFDAQFKKYLSDDTIFKHIVTRRKSVSQSKLAKLGMTKEEFIKKAYEIRQKVLQKKTDDVFEDLKILSRQHLSLSLSWPIVGNGRETYWATMDWMPEGKELVKYIMNTGLETIILTAGAGDYAKNGKQMWLKKNGLGDLDFNIVPKGTDKAMYADKDILLIDDKKENIDGFIKAGGMGILHTDTKNTIYQLKSVLSN